MSTKQLGSSGMNDGLARKWGKASLAINRSIGSCDVLDMRRVADCLIQIPTGVTSLTFYTDDAEDGTFAGYIKDNQGNALLVDVTGDDGHWIQFPSAVYAAGFLKIISDGADGTAKIQGKS